MLIRQVYQQAYYQQPAFAPESTTPPHSPPPELKKQRDELKRQREADEARAFRAEMRKLKPGYCTLQDTEEEMEEYVPKKRKVRTASPLCLGVTSPPS